MIKNVCLFCSSQFKHYLVKEEASNGRTQYTIQLSNQVPPLLYSLEDVVNYMVREFPEEVQPLKGILPIYSELQTSNYDTSIPRECSGY